MQNLGPHHDLSSTAVCKSFNMIPCDDFDDQTLWSITKIRPQFSPLHALMTTMTMTSIPGASENGLIVFGVTFFNIHLGGQLCMVVFVGWLDRDEACRRYIMLVFLKFNVSTDCTFKRAH